jgi:hypothetical protein
MAHLLIKLYPNGRVERLERCKSWIEREELIAFSLWLQPGLAALDVAARLWCDLERSGRKLEGPAQEGGQ